MINKKRLKFILDLMKEEEIIRVTELARQLNLSTMTVRRDLTYLEKQGLIKKIHGGATLAEKEDDDPPFFDRVIKFSEEKTCIGIAAAKLIKPHDIVFMDAGTTTYAMVQHIPEDHIFTAISTGLMTTVLLSSKPNINLISIGGDIHRDSLSSVNTVAIEQIKKYNADLAFISTKGIYVDEGAFEWLVSLIDVKKAMASMSRKTVLLADHSKFGKKSLSLTIPTDRIDIIVTDSKTPNEVIKYLRGRGVEVIVAPAYADSNLLSAKKDG